MDWTFYKDNSCTYYDLTIESRVHSDILDGLAQFWHRLLTTTMAAYHDDEWEAFEGSLWPDSGRFIAFPYLPGERNRRRERVSVQVCIVALEETWWQLWSADNVTEKGERQQATDAEQLVQEVWNWIADAIHREPAESVLRDVQQRRSVVMYVYEEHPSEHDVFQLPI
ncbi:MAG: hypothetical protein M3R24_35990 [Chloroflexota bacterium]|nr:hypothetical protein [Chloroflexota bacterium]